MLTAIAWQASLHHECEDRNLDDYLHVYVAEVVAGLSQQHALRLSGVGKQTLYQLSYSRVGCEDSA